LTQRIERGTKKADLFERRHSMAFERDEVLAKVGKRVHIRDYVDADGQGGMYFSKDVPDGTTGQVIHANLVYRFRHEEYDPADIYELVIEWDSLNRRIDRFDASDYERFITELA
jgi:hypothetical protein